MKDKRFQTINYWLLSLAIVLLLLFVLLNAYVYWHSGQEGPEKRKAAMENIGEMNACLVFPAILFGLAAFSKKDATNISLQ